MKKHPDPLIVASFFLIATLPLSAQDEPVPDPLATEIFARAMSETTTERALRISDFLRYVPITRRRDAPILLDTEVDVINGRTRFRQTVGFPSVGGGGYFVELDVYRNPPVTPTRIGFGLHNPIPDLEYLEFSNPLQLLSIAITPVSGIAGALTGLGLLAKDDFYSGFQHGDAELWIGPYTDRFPDYYPEFIRGKPVIGDVPTDGEQIFVTYDVRIVDYVDTRYWRGTAAFSYQTIIDILSGLVVADDEYGFPATRLDGGYSEYRWFGDDDFAIFNELSFELDLAAILQSGEAYLAQRSDGTRAASIYAIAERVIERISEELMTGERQTNDVTRFGTRLERLPFLGNLDLYGYSSEINGIDPAPQFWEAGFSWTPGPLEFRANGILPQELPEDSDPLDELVYGAGAGLNLTTKRWRFAVSGDRIARLTEPVFYRASADFENGIGTGDLGLTAGARVTAPELELGTRTQEFRLGLAQRNLTLQASMNQAFVDGEETRSVVGINLTAALR